MNQLDLQSITATRLKCLGLANPDRFSTAEIVKWHGAMQAQDLNSVLWSIALRRADRPTVSQVRESLETERIVRTWPMRGTLHLIHPTTARWMLNLLTPRIGTAIATRFAGLGLSVDVVDRCRRRVVEEIADGQPRTRSEMYALFESEGVVTSDQRGYHLIALFARECLLCFGPEVGGQPTYISFEFWTSGIADETPADALATLAFAFIRSHGPVTAADFARWTGLTLGMARKGFAATIDRCDCAHFENDEYWWSREQPLIAGDRTLYLLPGFDEFVLGYKDRSLFIRSDWQNRIVPGGNGVFRPTIVWDGQVVGTWSREIRSKSVRLAFEWWVTPSRMMKTRCEESAEAFATFLERPLDIVPKTSSVV